jgi:uncharacterized protein with beta-barrel porin domain
MTGTVRQGESAKRERGRVSAGAGVVAGAALWLALAATPLLADGLHIDPSMDPLVSGQQLTQSSLTRDLSATQLTNLAGHLQQLHAGYDHCGASGQLVLSSAQVAVNAADDSGLGSSAAGARSAARRLAERRGTTDATSNDKHHCLNDALFGSSSSGLWFGGGVNFGRSGASASNYFNSPGLTVGLDHQIASGLVVGTALGRGWNDLLLDDAGSETRVDSTQGTAYLTYRPVGPVTFDALIGYGDTALSNRRSVGEAVSVRGDRSGSSWFGALALDSAFQSAGFKLQPYLRSDFVDFSLNPYSEHGATELALRYGATASTLTTLSAGAVALRDFPLGASTLTPLLSLKYLRRLDDFQTTSLSYLEAADGYSLPGNVTPQILTTRKIGLRYRGPSGLSTELGANYVTTNATALAPSYSASVHAAF